MNTTWNNFYKTLIWSLLLYAVGFALWTVLYTETGNGDNVEHIHSTWLVAHGKMPYRDFFQHHNPLLWYIFAPFITFFSNILTLLDVAHLVGIIGGMLTFYVVYKIGVNFFVHSRYAVLLSLLGVCPPYFYIYCFNYNPDTFMALFYAIGLYALFSFWKNGKLATLCGAFMAFFVSFLFTQKVLMIFAVLGILSLFVFYHNKTPLKDILYALLLPLLCLVLFITFLYSQNALELYWLSNYPFNVKMQDYYGYRKIDVAEFQMLIPAVVCACISILCFAKAANKYFKIIAVLFIIELLLRCFYFAISPYYMLPLMIYMVCLNSVLFEKIAKKNVWLIFPILVGCLYYAVITPSKYLNTRGRDRTFATYLAQNITPCDYIVSSFFGNQSIISKDPHYYWSMLGHIDTLGAEMGIKPLPNLTEIVLNYKPKLVFGGEFWNSYYWHQNQYVLLQSIDTKVIDKYYFPTPFPDFYILRYEFRGKNCQYDSKKKDWFYAN